ncbi:MAG: 4-hydroxy-tetrahydrodipicolinate reductase, partial [Candidatus Margulisiibacteriota bacterium]
MAKIKVIINGAKGKMGKETIKAVSRETDLDLVAQTDIGDNLVEEIKKHSAEVVVDFTRPDAAMANIRIILTSGAHAVVGTTGISKDDLAEIEKLCEANKVNCVVAPNFAIGAVLMMQFAKDAAKHMPHAEIIEMHHQQKVDRPSGTAVKTAQMMKEVMGEGADIPIHSVRLPGYVASQEVIFGGLG